MEDTPPTPSRRLDDDVEDHLERISDAVFALDADFRFTYLNGKAQELLGVEQESVKGSLVWDEFPAAVGTAFQRQYERAMREGDSVTFSEYFDPLDTWFEVSAYPSETGLTVYFRDVTRRKRREEQLERQRDRLDILETFTHVIAEVSHVAEETASRAHVEQLVCSRLVETTPLTFAWVGRVDESGGDDVAPSAWAGTERGYLDEIRVSADESDEHGQGPAGQAIAQRRVCVTQSIADDDAFEPWREAALDRDFRSCACIPLEYRGRVYGVLCLYARLENAFGDGEREGDPLHQLGDTISHAIDTVERRRREEQLQRRQEEFSALVDDVEEYAIFRLDTEGHVASWNRGAEQIKGYDESEILGRHFSTFHTEENVEAGHPSELLEEAAREGQAKEEGWRVRADGTRFWASVTISALYDDDGALQGFTKVVRDMTDRKERERRLEAVFNRTFQFMGLLEPDGTVLKVNNAAVEFAGRDREELVGKPFWEVPWWNTQGEIDEQVRDAVGWASAGEFVRYEAEAESPTGEEVVVDFSITPVTDESGKVVLLVPEGRDVTERKEREEELRRERQRLEFMNRILRHNLLNGLNVVSARTEILEDFVDDRGRSHLETVAGRVEEMVDLVETMRSFTKTIVETENHELEPRSLTATLASEVERLEETSADASIDVEGSIPDVDVLADDLLDQVFENVLTNAVQHNDKERPEVRVWVEREDGRVAVHVADNGPGVPDEEKTHIVEKGVDGLSTPGSGFGLYLVKELLDSYGGDIEVRDNDPEGAVFVLVFRTPDR
jgi:PAS domain S-box-containing protein